MTDAKSHWEKVYQTKRPNEVSWYRPHWTYRLGSSSGVVQQFTYCYCNIATAHS
jgi:hypothetical protein